MRSCLLFLLTFLLVPSFAQPPVIITPWKNGALGCYNIIHDDYGDLGVVGINNYADTMNFNRGLKITFGAITSACESNSGMYAKAVSMIEDHGHEIINHTHNHTCAVYQSWCTDGLWAETATQNFATEIDYSTTSITNNTGHTPRFFIYPYDQFNTAANNYLKTKGYIGSRTGDYNTYSFNNYSPDATGFFRPAFVVDVQNIVGQDLAMNLNYWVDEAINNDAWVSRELHNVGNTGWGHVSVSDYRNHLDYVKSKVDAGELWVGTISEILTYRIQDIEYNPVSSMSGGNIVVSFTKANRISSPKIY